MSLGYYALSAMPADMLETTVILTTIISATVSAPTCWKLVRDAERLRAAKAAAEAANARAERADRAKSAFLATMSHEIRTPMNGVLGVAELLNHTALDERQKSLVEIIKTSGDALLEIIDDVLDLTRIEAARVELRPAPFSPRDLAEEVARLIAGRLAGRPVEALARVDPALPARLVGDSGRLRQILVNLAGNAAKFTETGHVLIDLSGVVSDGRCALIMAVEDTGPGVPEEERARIFEAFEQIDDPFSRRRQGAGLGLAISVTLARLMGGAIRVEAAPGGGARFVMEATLPIDAPASTAQPLLGFRVCIRSASPLHASILSEVASAAGAVAAPAPVGDGGSVLFDWRGETAAEISAILGEARAAGWPVAALTPLGARFPAPGAACVLPRPVAAAALASALAALRGEGAEDAAPSASRAHRL